MKKWHRNTIVKAILMGIAHVASVVLIIALLWILAYPSSIADTFTGSIKKTYIETKEFTDKVFVSTTGILNDISRQDDFETDGKVDRTKIVDIQTYQEYSKLINQNETGIAYTIDELIKWIDAVESYKCGSSHNSSRQENPIIVCQKEDGSYEYCYYTKFKSMVENEEMYLVLRNSDYYEQDILNMLREGSIYSGDMYLTSVLDSERRVKYVNCWNFDGTWMEELYQPQGAESILDIVNTDPRWNGRLNEAFDMIYQTAWSIRDTVEVYEENMDRWEDGNTNLSYIFADLEKKTISTNKKGYEDYEKLNVSLDNLRQSGSYLIIRPKLQDCEINMPEVDLGIWNSEVKCYTESEDFVYAVAVDTAFPILDEYAEANAAYKEYAPYMSVMVILAIVSAAVLIGCIVWLTIVAGRRPDNEELHLCRWDRWKTEIAAVLVAGVWGCCIGMLAELWSQSWPAAYYMNESNAHTMYNSYSNTQFIIAGMAGFITCTFFLTGYLSLVRRIKASSLWQDSLTRSLLKSVKQFTGYVIKHVPVLWRTIFVFGGFVLLHWIALSTYDGVWDVMAILAEAAALLYLLNMAIGRKKIREGIERIANGDVDYKISLEHLHGQQLEIAEMVNNIGDGLQAAVEKSMKSERMKTDLITNVSHDIKTPLTSIINYIDLLKRENFTDPKVQGYLEVLETKAQRLKTLTEDVVEASKVSSGNISLEKMKINLVEMIQQTSGEFEEKFKKRGLKEVLNLPEKEAVIFVDGRRMWRVLENIYNNAAKYAMEGTRVYADLKAVGENVIFSLKNISEQPLNIEADELTERFIRGDISRNTEGSGLGLSIAKNLTEMQGGEFELYLDGDLFKVTIKFPKC